VAPKVSSALHITASRVQPVTPGRTGIRRLLDWRLLLGIGAAVAAAGAAAAFTMRKRYESATADAKDDAYDATGNLSSGSVTVKQPGGPTAAADAEEDVAKPEVNGRVSTSRH
jgi:multisubunit Na+/H+ antiporter MnhB subunit